MPQPSPGFLLCPVLLFQRLRRGGKERAQQSCESCLDDSKSRQTISQGNSLLLPWPDLWQLLMLVKTSTFSIRYLCDIHRASSASAVCQGLGCSRDPWQCTKGTKLSTARRKIYCAHVLTFVGVKCWSHWLAFIIMTRQKLAWLSLSGHLLLWAQKCVVLTMMVVQFTGLE